MQLFGLYILKQSTGQALFLKMKFIVLFEPSLVFAKVVHGDVRRNSLAIT